MTSRSTLLYSTLLYPVFLPQVYTYFIFISDNVPARPGQARPGSEFEPSSISDCVYIEENVGREREKEI